MNKGYIIISDHLYHNEWALISQIFKDFKPYYMRKVGYFFQDWCYYGFSSLFDEVKKGENIPQYHVIFTANEDGTYTYKFEKI
jgi:hypothetical protein